jgi:hypothetical protein
MKFLERWIRILQNCINVEKGEIREVQNITDRRIYYRDREGHLCYFYKIEEGRAFEWVRKSQEA